MDQIADNTLWITHLAAGESASLSRGAQAPDSLEKIFMDSMDHIALQILSAPHVL